MFLLDTNVLSELLKKRPHGAVVAWLAARDDTELFVSAVTIGEIQVGIERTRLRDAQKADEIETWLELIAHTYNIVPMDAKAFRVWAKLMHRKSSALYEDAMIAATATVHRLTIATRNVSDFKPFKVPLVNPFV
jgi:toxin FitB